jgi:hypothetical protein
MNIINQREIIKRMAEAGALSAKGQVLALDAPVFVWPLPKKASARSQDEVEFLQNVVLEPETEMPRLLPFPVFRIATQLGFDLWWHKGTRALTCMRYMAPGNFYSPDPKADTVTIHDFKWMPAEIGPNGEKKRRARVEVAMEALMDWRWVDKAEINASHKSNPEGMKEVFLDPARDLQSFLFDIEYPGNVVLGVGPAAKPGKSVEWRQARTHYCILRRGDARACRREATGPSEEQTARAAHWRKAHFRRLRSEVFTQKRGQLVAVRHAWVGPKEWEGKDGKVYRVMNFEGGRSTEGSATEGI